MAGDAMEWGKKKSGREESGIQALLDEALRGGAKGKPLEPLNLDMRIQKDWGAPEPGIPSRLASGRVPERDHTSIQVENPFSYPASTPPKSGNSALFSQAPAGKVTSRKFTTSPIPRKKSLHRPALAVFLLIFLCGLGMLSFTPTKMKTPETLLEDAGRHHTEGDFQGALQSYAALRQMEDLKNQGPEQARLSFLEAGAAERLWKQGIDTEKNFTMALQRYDEAIQSDQTPMRVYASEALMAKAEMNAAKALASQPHDVSAALIARQSLETLVDSPEYSASPATALGIAHRRLAELIRAENPERAIELLIQSKNRRGGLSEGLEDLLIARIYQEYLGDDDHAYEFYTLVQTNPLASQSSRDTAKKALEGIRGTGLDEPGTFDSKELEDLPQLKAD